MMETHNFHVTIVIPAYNEQERIAKTLYGIKDYLSQQSYSSDIIIIDDGSHDLTSEVVRKAMLLFLLMPMHLHQFGKLTS